VGQLVGSVVQLVGGVIQLFRTVGQLPVLRGQWLVGLINLTLEF
jgi:hypothetical protein